MKTLQFVDALHIIGEDQIRQLGLAGHIKLADSAELCVSGTVVFGTGIEFRGRCEIGDGSRIESGCVFTDVKLGQNNHVRPYSILTSFTAGDDNLFGPFCFVRDGCQVLNNCIIGSHVEAARSTFGSGVKISHQAYIGDAALGQNVIIGAGVVFCNWDGTMHQPVRIGENSMIGSGTMLVAPLTVGNNVTVGAGSVVTSDVASGTRFIQPRQARVYQHPDGAVT